MKNINDKIKKWLVVGSGLAISAVLILTIGSQFKKEPITDIQIPQQNNKVQDVVVDKPVNTEKENEITVAPIEIPEQTQADNGAVDTGTEQKIQGDVEKPTYTEEQLKDSTQKPNGEKVDPPKNEGDEKTVTTTEPPKKIDEPQGGDTNSKGETYLPGFGWIENSGENQGTVVDGDGDINKQVGTMD